MTESQPPAAYEQSDEKTPHWHVVVLTRAGKLIVRKNLAAPAARKAAQQLAANQRPKVFINMPIADDARAAFKMPGVPELPEDAIEVHVLGPKGHALHAWGPTEPEVVDLSAEV